MTVALNITSNLPLISCVMPTFGRPAYVPEAVACFLQQDYPHKELILLNDCPGQMYVGDLPGVRIVNVPERFKTLGDKRNASIEMASGEIIAVWDDDDISLPWRLSWSWEEMNRYKTPFYRSTEFLAYWGEEKLHDNRSVPGWVSHGHVAFAKELWEMSGKYPAQGVGEDALLFSAFDRLLNTDFVTHPIPRSERFYVMRGSSQYQHMSIGGGREPLDLRPGTYSIEPRSIQDKSLRTACDQQIDRHGIHGQAALSRSVPSLFEPILSICIALKNRSRMLHEGRLLENFPRTVRSLSDLAEEFGPIELIVADFHSDDWPLSQWLVSAGNLRVKIIPVDGDFSRGRGLNAAARQASCDRLFLTDADILVRPEALKRGLSSLERGVVRFPIFRYLDIEGQEQGFEDFTRGLTFLTRDLMQRSGGVPEFFSWGGDDDIFYDRLAPLAAVERERDGDLLHQWHSESSRHEHHVRPRKHDYERYVKHSAEAQFAVFKIEHPDWVGNVREIVLWKDGRFERPGIDSGTYVYEPGVRLTLNWSRWTPEVLHWDNDRGCYRDSQREDVMAWPRVHPHGYWLSQDANEHHVFDQGVCSELTQFFRSQGGSVVDFGCGPGKYVQALLAAGVPCEGYDGNPMTEQLTGGTCKVLDLSSPVDLGTMYDWVLSLEVGEHIPPEHEDTFLRNIDRHNRKGVVLSWAIPGQGGYGHFNERNNDYIRERFAEMGYSSDPLLEQRLRNSASNCWWFRDTIMVFRREAALPRQ